MPVIHVLNAEQMLGNISVAKYNGADGVFLVNHGCITFQQLLGFYAEAVETYPDFWIGLNCLDLPSHEVFGNVPGTVHGIWADNGGICDTDVGYAKLVYRSRRRSSFTGMYFGGVAFKGYRVEDPKTAAKRAANYMDIVTTSGPRTGQAASREKIISMKEAIGDKSLAIASGVTVDNVQDFLPYVDYFLVATGISSSFHELDPVKVFNLAKAIHEYAN